MTIYELKMSVSAHGQTLNDECELKLMCKGRFCCIEQSLQVKLSLKKQHFSSIPSHTKTF